MKKLTLLFLIVAANINVINAQEKAFEKGNLTISIGAGFGLYGTKSNIAYDSTYTVGGTKTTVRVPQTKHSGALSGVYPICVEYGITKWLGLGVRGAFSKYSSSKDTTHNKPNSAYNNNVPHVTSADVGALANFHFIKTKHFDMPLQLGIGYSHLNYQAHDSASSIAKGGGFNFSLSLIPRIYFGNHIGMYFNLGYVGYSYPNLIISDNYYSNINSPSNAVFKLSANGVNLGIGLIVKLL